MNRWIQDQPAMEGELASAAAAGRRRAALPLVNLLAVVGLASLVLGYGRTHSGIASTVTDPISHVRAQDESIYAHISLRMAIHGDWLTPRIMGRLLLEKPPLFLWMSALSVNWFGPSLFALRAPSLLAAVAATAMIFRLAGRWAGERSSLEAGWTAAALVLSNPLWHIFARLGYMDMLFTLWMVAAIYVVQKDPDLATWPSRIAFAGFTAAAIMTKSVAGLIPLFVLVLAAAVRKERGITERSIGPVRILQVCALIGVVVAPWHVYQIWTHPRWLWADYVQKQLLSFGTHPVAQVSNEPQAWFYLRRLVETDPVLMGLAAVGLPSMLLQAWKRARADSLVLAVSMAVIAAALLAFQYRNLPYALSIVPFLAVLGAVYFPRWRWRTAVLSAVFLAKIAFPAQPWGLPLGASNPTPSAASIRSYARQKRPNELIVVSPDDNFYSCTLAIPRVRYVYVDPGDVVRKYAPHYSYLGIVVTAQQFLQMNGARGMFLERLKDWGVDSDEPLATAIVVRSDAEIADLVRASPLSDFLVPDAVGGQLPPDVLSEHSVVGSGGEWFLLARRPPPDPPRSPFAERPPTW